MGSHQDGHLPWWQRPRESLRHVGGQTAAGSVCIPVGLIIGGYSGIWRAGTALDYLVTFAALIGGLACAALVILYVLRPVKIEPHSKPRPRLDFSVPILEKRKAARLANKDTDR
jgi:hypothetical protein